MFTRISILLIAVSVSELTMSATTHKSSDSAIVYPGPVKQMTETRYGTRDDVPENCKHQNYCHEKPIDYPEDQFNKMFKDLKPIPQPTLVISELGDRQGDPDELDGCESEVTYEPPYQVREKRGNWRVVVQAPKSNYVQKVRLETCKTPKSSCFNDFPHIPGITTFCKQKTGTWRFLVANDQGGAEEIEVDLPICCSCHYKNS